MKRTRSGGLLTHRLAIVTCAVALFAAMSSASAQTASSTTLDRIRDAGRIKLGYRTDARPFSYRDDSGKAAGYTIAICQQVVTAVKSELQLPSLPVDWVPVTAQDRFQAVQQGTIDLLCGADTVTLDRRSAVSFSIPIFPGGIGALVRADAPLRFREVLSGHEQSFRPTWRANATNILQARAFVAVAGTTAEKWLAERITDLHILTTVAPATDYNAGIQALVERRVDALFGERAILLETARQHAAARDLLVIDRLFTYQPLALALSANDERFRLVVDSALAHFYASGQLGNLYATFFGEPDASAINFFKWIAVPE